MEESYQSHVWPGISEVAKERDVNLIYFSGRSLDAPYLFNIHSNQIYDLIHSDNIDGLIAFSGTLSNFITYDQFCEFLQKYKNIPIVSLSLNIPKIPSITVDNVSGMRELISHLITDHNYKKIAFICGPKGHPEAEERFQTYKDVLKEFNIEYNPDLFVQGDFVELTGIKAIDILIDQRKIQFDAVVSSNDDMAFGAIKALQRRNLSVPKDVAVVGFDNVSRSYLCNPPLTTVHQPMYEQGRKSLELLIDIIEGKKVPEKVKLHTEVIYRRSCNCFPKNLFQISKLNDVPTKIDSLQIINRKEQEIISELLNTANYHGVELEEFFIKNLLESLILGIKNKDFLPLLQVLEDFIRKEIVKNNKINYWHDILSKLYSLIVPIFGDNDNILYIEKLFHQAQFIVGEIVSQSEKIQQEEDKESYININSIREVIMSAFSIEQISESIINELPKIGIKSCYLVLYENYNIQSPWARLISAYNEEGPIKIDLKKSGERFKKTHLVPKKYLPKNRQYNLIIESLFFKDENKFGFIIVEQPKKITEFELLARNIGTALKGALLLQERQLLLEKLSDSNKELDEFASIIAHDLKQPLTIIKSSLELLKDVYYEKLDSNSKELIDLPIEASNRMRKMITDLLDLSRVSTSIVDFDEVNLESILKQVISDLQLIIDENNAKITYDSLPTIIGIKTYLIQLFENLITNAIKFHSQEPPEIHIGVEMKSNKWIFSIKDNGIGINKNDFKRIFQIFQRLHTNEEYKGTGIGLAICKKIVEKHNGKIWVESELGKGSTFIFELQKKKLRKNK
ncbi:MAG: substrate-binding domain-containing protein [Candidatus Lokiarchaeota archaeon]|nr:substrate-binding domain-containing protein [Candidatus Lokiarchaeota archaeon]